MTGPERSSAEIAQGVRTRLEVLYRNTQGDFSLAEVLRPALGLDDDTLAHIED